jgi:hypothetical protein
MEELIMSKFGVGSGLRRYRLSACGIATAVTALAAFAPSVVAEEVTMTMTCQSIGNSAPEPLGDREGHAISIGEVSCRVDGGPLSGGVLTGMDIWEWDGTNAVSLANNGIVRKPGATAMYQNTEAKLVLTMTDGKVTGATASGKGHWRMATGTAASLMGKACSYTANVTGPGQFTTTSKCE